MNGNFQNNLEINTERIKGLKVIGEAVGQVVVRSSTCINAIKIDRIKASLADTTDHVFQNKVVKQGIIRKEVFYVNSHNILRFLTEDVPFTLTVEIPGLRPDPFVEIQNHLLSIDVDFRLTPARQCLPGCLKQVIVADILVIASEWTQLDVVVGGTLC